MTSQATAVVRVRCRNGHVRDIGPYELRPNEYPMCSVCHRPMFPTGARSSRRTLQTPKGNTLTGTRTTGASAGDILQWRRKRGGWTVAQVAEADGEWTPNEVFLMEGQTSQSKANIARYLLALNKLEGE